MHFRHACVFIDGENMRHSLVDLFGKDFNPADYLPKQADWERFFAYLVHNADADRRLRTYWYVVDEIDFFPWGLSKLLKRGEITILERVIRQHKPNAIALDAIADTAARRTKVETIANSLIKSEAMMKRRFEGWQEIQDGISHKFDSVEFRRAGSIRMNLFTQKFGQEKGVDVKLATDLLVLRDIYDAGIIVSGDGDYVPAVSAVKDLGKHIINVSFLKKSGGMLPGGARRLSKSTDRVIEVPYKDMQNFMRVTAKPTAPPLFSSASAPAVAAAGSTVTAVPVVPAPPPVTK